MNACQRRRGSPRGDRGAAAVEFALVFPILLVVLMGMINFGAVFAQSQALGNSARQAARFGAVAGPTCADVIQHARDNAVSIGLEPADIADGDVSITGVPGCPASSPCLGSTAGSSVRVVISHYSEFLVPMPIPGFPAGVDLEGVGEFRCEFS